MKRVVITFLKFFLLPLYLLQYGLLWIRIPLDKDEWCFVCDGHLGDDYRLLVFLGAFAKKMRTKKLSVVIGKKYSSMPKMFPYVSKIIPLRKIPNMFVTGFVSAYVEVLPSRPILVHLKRPILYQTLPRNKSICNNALDTYKNYIGLNPFTMPARPRIGIKSRQNAKRKFHRLGLKVGKTVVIFPNANTHMIKNKGFWRKISAALKNHGFSVISNSKRGEKNISGIDYVDLELNEILPFVELAGYIISIRSGICDLLASSNATKFILYPDVKSRAFDTITAYRYNSGKLEELIINNGNSDRISNIIINKIIQQADLGIRF